MGYNDAASRGIREWVILLAAFREIAQRDACEINAVLLPAGIACFKQDSDVRFARINSDQTRNFVGSPLEANDWALVVMTGENDTGLGTSTLQLYIDGVLVNSDSAIPGDVTFNGIGGFGASPNLTIGAARPDSGDAGYRPYDGLLDEVAIYDYVLSPDQISAHANIPEPGSVLLLSLGGLVLGLRRRGRKLG